MDFNHNYNLPQRGATDWDQPLNENFEKLDTDIEIRDERNTLDEYQPKDGAKFLAIDTGDVYIGNGNRWIHLGVISAGSGGGSSSGDVFGDNVAVVSSAEEIQSALDRYKTIVIAGQIDVSRQSTFTVDHDTSIHGFSLGGVQTWQNQSVLIDNKAAPTFNITGDGVRIFGLGVRQNHTDGVAIRSSGHQTVLGYCGIYGESRAIELVDPEGNTPTEPKIEHCQVIGSSSNSAGNGSIGILVDDRPDTKLYDNIIRSFDTCVEIRGFGSGWIRGNHIYSHPGDSSRYMLNFVDVESTWRVQGNRLEENATEAVIQIDSDYASGYQITGNYIQAATDGHGLHFTGNYFEKSIIRHNRFGTFSRNSPDTAISMPNAEFLRTDIGNNLFDDVYRSRGVVFATDWRDPPQAEFWTPGQFVLDSRGELWVAGVDEMIKL